MDKRVGRDSPFFTCLSVESALMVSSGRDTTELNQNCLQIELAMISSSVLSVFQFFCSLRQEWQKQSEGERESQRELSYQSAVLHAACSRKKAPTIFGCEEEKEGEKKAGRSVCRRINSLRGVFVFASFLPFTLSMTWRYLASYVGGGNTTVGWPGLLYRLLVVRGSLHLTTSTYCTCFYTAATSADLHPSISIYICRQKKRRQCK